MKTELSLNDEQYNKVLEINKSFNEKSAEARKNSADRAVVATAVKGFNEEKETKLKTVLTEEQFKKYIADKEKREKILKQRMANSKDLPELNRPALKQ